MKVKDLIDRLRVLNPDAEVMVMTETDDDRGYQTVFDCEEEYSDLVTIGCGYPVYMKEQVIKGIKSNDHKIMEVFESSDIGQGMGYKLDKEWNKILPNEVIYIPEVGYSEYDTDHIRSFPVNADCVYSKQDFINIIKEYVKPSRVEEEAQALFNMVDWQCPETLADELEFDEDYED